MRSGIGIGTTLLFLTLPLNTLKAQDYPVLGVAPPSSISYATVTDASSVTIFNSVKVLGEGFVGNPRVQLRVVGIWGPVAGLDSGALTTKLYVAVNLDGTDLAVFELSELLDPEVRCMLTEDRAAVAYLTYGLPHNRYSLRLEASIDSLVLSEGQTSKCP